MCLSARACCKKIIPKPEVIKSCHILRDPSGSFSYVFFYFEVSLGIEQNNWDPVPDLFKLKRSSSSIFKWRGGEGRKGEERRRIASTHLLGAYQRSSTTFRRYRKPNRQKDTKTDSNKENKKKEMTFQSRVNRHKLAINNDSDDSLSPLQRCDWWCDRRGKGEKNHRRPSVAARTPGDGIHRYRRHYRLNRWIHFNMKLMTHSTGLLPVTYYIKRRNLQHQFQLTDESTSNQSWSRWRAKQGKYLLIYCRNELQRVALQSSLE